MPSILVWTSVRLFVLDGVRNVWVGEDRRCKCKIQVALSTKSPFKDYILMGRQFGSCWYFSYIAHNLNIGLSFSQINLPIKKPLCKNHIAFHKKTDDLCLTTFLFIFFSSLWEIIHDQSALCHPNQGRENETCCLMGLGLDQPHGKARCCTTVSSKRRRTLHSPRAQGRC